MGWEFFVERQSDVGAAGGMPEATPLARWQLGLGGTTWLAELVARGLATDLGGQGYPCRWRVSAGVLAAALADRLPAPQSPLILGSTQMDLARLQGLDPGEMLLVEAWDQS